MYFIGLPEHWRFNEWFRLRAILREKKKLREKRVLTSAARYIDANQPEINPAIRKHFASTSSIRMYICHRSRFERLDFRKKELRNGTSLRNAPITVHDAKERQRRITECTINIQNISEPLLIAKVGPTSGRRVECPRDNNYSPNARPAISISLAHFSLMLMGILFKRVREEGEPPLTSTSSLILPRVLCFCGPLPCVARFAALPSVARKTKSSRCRFSLPRFVYDDALRSRRRRSLRPRGVSLRFPRLASVGKTRRVWKCVVPLFENIWEHDEMYSIANS